MRTRRSPRNQERLWRALGGDIRPTPRTRTRTKLVSRAAARRLLLARWQVISPDGIPIRPESFATHLQAAAYLAQWCQRFAGQGYYAAADGRRIPVAELVAACTFEPVKGGDR